MSDLIKLAEKLLADGPHKSELTPRRVRALFGGVYVVDTVRAKYVWEHPYYPQLYVPASDIQNAKLVKNTPIKDGAAHACTLSATSGRKAATDRVLSFEQDGPLKGLVKIEFAALDQWFEEDTPIYVHPKDPYKRIDILPSTRKVRVEIDGAVVAESQGSVMHLFETTLPVRYYLPKTAVNWELITESSTTTKCPYKGEANYYNVIVNGKEHKDVVWWYRYPTPESITVAGLVCFYNEKVDIFLDGEKLERPKTKFS